MKTRKVAIILEVMTDKPLSVLKDKEWWLGGMKDEFDKDPDLEIVQVQVNVIKDGR